MALKDVPDSDLITIFMTNAISPIRVADQLFDTVAQGGMIAFMSSILGSIGTNDDGRAEQGRCAEEDAGVVDLVHEVGWRDATVERIAGRAGVAKGFSFVPGLASLPFEAT